MSQAEPSSVRRGLITKDSVDQFQAAARKLQRQPATSAAPAKLTLGSLEFRSAASLNVSTDRRFLVDGLIPRVGTFIIYGASGTCKSFVAVDLACRIAAGVSWAGRATVEGKVLFVATEDIQGIEDRINAWCLHNSLDRSQLSLYISRGPVDLSDWKSLHAFAEAVAHLGDVRAIIIDTAAKSIGGADEMSARDVGVVSRNCERLAQVADCAVGVVHHTARDSATARSGPAKPRGSSAWESNFDCCLWIHNHAVNPVKVKNGPCPTPITFEVAPRAIGRDSDGHEIATLVATCRPGTVADALAASSQTPHVRKRKVDDRAAFLLQRIARSPGSQLSTTEARQALKSHFGLTGDNARKALKAALIHLTEAGLASISDDLIRASSPPAPVEREVAENSDLSGPSGDAEQAEFSGTFVDSAKQSGRNDDTLEGVSSSVSAPDMPSSQSDAEADLSFVQLVQ